MRTKQVEFNKNCDVKVGYAAGGPSAFRGAFGESYSLYSGHFSTFIIYGLNHS